MRGKEIGLNHVETLHVGRFESLGRLAKGSPTLSANPAERMGNPEAF